MSREPWQISREMFLSEDEVATVLRFVRSRVATANDEAWISVFTDRVVIELLLFSGIRSSEFCRLTVPDLVATQGTCALLVRESPTRQRTVHLPRWLMDAMQVFIRDVRPSLLLPNATKTEKIRGPLVLNERGRAYERTALYRRVQRILTVAGLGERASVQLLRHTYGYLAYKQTGGNLLFVQRQLGHAHPMVTAIYAQFVEENSDQVAETIGAAFCPSVSDPQ